MIRVPDPDRLLNRAVAEGELGYAAWQAESSAADDVWEKARDEMFQTVPTSRAGAMALVGMLDRNDPAPEDMSLLVRTLAEAIPSH